METKTLKGNLHNKGIGKQHPKFRQFLFLFIVIFYKCSVKIYVKSAMTKPSKVFILYVGEKNMMFINLYLLQKSARHWDTGCFIFKGNNILILI